MSGHGSSPFFCPYCGDETLRPYGETHGEWRCESCRRAFALRTVKQSAVAPEPAVSAARTSEAGPPGGRTGDTVSAAAERETP
jgi:ribosomal protein L37AE/L43A